MKLQIVSVRDRALDAFGRPFFVPTIGAAVRSFQDEVNNKESPMHKHADDYDMYLLGTFDEESGKFENLPEPKQVCIGKQMLTGEDK